MKKTMRASTVILLPDTFSDPIRVIRLDDGGKRTERYASLTDIRTGEDGQTDTDIRRYEIGTTTTTHLTDLVNARVVIKDNTAQRTSTKTSLPEWARRSAALHPDRHDLASWFGAAQKDSSAPWVAHLALVVRDAFRKESHHHPATLALPDRAFLAATGYETQSAVKPITRSFMEQVHAIDENGHRTDVGLAPMPLAGVNESGHREAIITRTQAVIAEALINAIDAQPIPTSADIQSRWANVVSADHAGRLRLCSDGTYSAPIAILDDHNNAKFTATLILATLRIALSETVNDIWLEYHQAYDINASRPLDINLATALMQGVEQITDDHRDLLTAIHEQALPVIELSTTPSGEFTNRDLIRSLPDASPLLRVHPVFTFPDAILAFMTIREPETFAQSWSSIIRRSTKGGDTETRGAEDDKVVANQITPPEKSPASETGKVGEVDQAPIPRSKGSDDDRVGDDDENTTGEESGGGDDGPEIERDDTQTAMSGEGPLGGSGQARLDPDPASEAITKTTAQQAKDVADAISDADQLDDDGDIDPFGSKSADKVADSSRPSLSSDDSRSNSDGSDGENIAHDDDAQRPPTIADLLSSLTDSDLAAVARVREAVARRKKGGVPPVPTDQTLKEDMAKRPEHFYENVWQHILTNFTKPGDKKLDQVRQCLLTDTPWLQLLFLLNLTDRLKGVERHRSATKAKAIRNAELCIHQCEIAQIALPPMSSPLIAAGHGANTNA